MKKWRGAAALGFRAALPLARPVEQSPSKPGNPGPCTDSCTADCERETGNCGCQVHPLFAASEVLRYSDGQRPEPPRRRYNNRRRTSTRVDTRPATLESKLAFLLAR